MKFLTPYIRTKHQFHAEIRLANHLFLDFTEVPLNRII
ncbi:hypothetical protein LEP1GSC172_3911 [Leptospira noguchii]|uniref:Uncharacterized protein n=1 Tax=Leptospira noguchii TaxID=28182 RepID=M6V6S7_9LEPT|nr:hypothetical protein LEP1GSC172_3911 [Leptospira noguchii]